MFEKVLIANRGEIALRIIRACRDLGIRTVAVHSTIDSEAMHVRLADESVCIGPPAPRDSYLSMAALVSAASVAGADAIHPGLGFLAENATFAQVVTDHGFTFIGPSPDHIATMGDKIAAKAAMVEVGISPVPGSDAAVESDAEAARIAEEIGYPVLVKAAAGGGGRGMQIAREPTILAPALALARREAAGAFGDSRVFIEKFIEKPRHIEIQILADSHGNAVHLGERDCSIQRRHQKVVEESPSPVLDDAVRAEIGARAATAVRQLGYLGAGTLEFLFDGRDFHFIEMNTRLQVEHPVTEMVTGVDLVREQLTIAAGGKLQFGQDDVRFDGHAIECRVNAEDARTFVPSPGRVREYHPPGGPGVRVDSALFAGCMVPPHYDSLIAKLIVHGPDRPTAVARLARALDEYVIEGIDTNLELHRGIAGNRDFSSGAYDIHWLERWMDGA